RADARLHGNARGTVELVGSELRGRLGGSTIAGVAMTDTRMTAVSDTGTPLDLRIAGVTVPPPGGDRWQYRVEYRETDGDWYPICFDPDSGEPTTAYALAGYWDRAFGRPGDGGKIADPAVFTFACRSAGTIGKCVDMGYRPWAAIEGTSLDEHHQACVRLMRNDYC